MIILDQIKTLEMLCANTGLWGIYISWHYDGENEFEELVKAVPYLNLEKHSQAMIESSAILLFDTEKEMEEKFNMTVGDDGPTKLNSYNGPLRVYALTCDPTGQCLDENT